MTKQKKNTFYAEDIEISKQEDDINDCVQMLAHKHEEKMFSKKSSCPVFVGIGKTLTDKSHYSIANTCALFFLYILLTREFQILF